MSHAGSAVRTFSDPGGRVGRLISGARPRRTGPASII